MTPQDINNQFMLRVGTILHGTYRIDSYLSSGGFGNTYIATNIEFDEKYAIKEFFMKGVTERDETSCLVSVSNANNYQQFEEQREKFKKEARRLRKLKNEHIVKVHDLFEENGTAYYVMDYIDGESLAEKMKKTGRPLPEEEVRTILLQILGALKEVHQNEIWHLDLKPGNIMLDKSGNAYLIDFGASKQIRANGGMTTSTALCYTPGYAPIEQIGQMYDRFGPWTDIYALGATVYNLLTNQNPPMGVDIEDEEDVAFKFPKEVSDEMRHEVIWMMQPKRKARPQSVDEIFAAIAQTSVNPQISKHIINGSIQSDVSINEVSTSEETVFSGNKPFNASNKEKSDLQETLIAKREIPKALNEKGKVDDSNINAVDLGLSVLWADCNVGGTHDAPQGDLFGWGDVTGKKESLEVGDYVPLRKYITHQIEGDVGGTIYDIASYQWGNRWRMPNRKQWKELIDNCQWKYVKRNKVAGYRVIGPNGNEIFLPATGIRFGKEISNVDSGYYWTSELSEDDRKCAYYYYFDSEKCNDNVNTRNYVYSGRAVRPICKKK